MKLLKYRIMLLGLASGFLLLATNSFIRRSIVESSQAVTGTSFDIARIRTNWRTARIELSGVQAADPARSDRNLFEADRVVLDVNPSALLRRRFLVERSQVQGIRVGTPRSAPPDTHTKTKNDTATKLSRGFADRGMQWFDILVNEIGRGKSLSLESVSQSQAMCDKWPEQCRELIAESATLQAQLATMEQEIRQAGDNPLRNLNPYQSAATTLDEISKQIIEIRGEIDRQQQQLLLDQEQVCTTIRNEKVQLTTECQLPNLDGEALGKYLLADEVAGQVDSIVEWLRWGRQFIPALYEHAVPGSNRGQNVIFAGCRPQPDILVKTLVLSGGGGNAGEKFTIEGTLTNLSNRPAINNLPTELVVQTTGAVQTAIHAVMDARGEAPKDRIFINCPRWIQAERQWGNPEQLAFIASGGESKVSILIDIQNNSQLKGEVVIRQGTIMVTPRLNDRISVQPLPTLLSEACKKINHLDVTVKLSGSLDFPKWELRSNFGNELAQHLQQTFQDALTQQRLASVDRDQQEAQVAVDALVAQISTQHATIAKQLDDGSDQLQSIHDHIAERVRQNDGVVQPDSPLREVYRR
jgi:uncharacterized protein (TIGR03545 family)